MIGIIDYGTGNIKSVGNALARLGAEYIVTSQASIIEGCDRVILPGVGSAGMAMENLKRSGLDKIIPALTQPVLGICLGMQLLCAHSEEDDTECLGIFKNRVQKFPEIGKKIPHIGWNTIGCLKGNLYSNIEQESFVYFVHSYFAGVDEKTIAASEYGIRFSASLNEKNFFGCQFHPEKSGDIGDKILHNFLSNNII
ncbi:MAG: imidazole glycerol phosphate synthase subunit HisH [Bacteroidales bacterium]|nr:imidazole glycerol phosphate synthase subunit HisH [Bacteroidales bacterium]